MRKFTYKDARDWKVISITGQVLHLIVTDKDGTKRRVDRFDGFRSASNAAKKLGGVAVRA